MLTAQFRTMWLRGRRGWGGEESYISASVQQSSSEDAELSFCQDKRKNQCVEHTTVKWHPHLSPCSSFFHFAQIPQIAALSGTITCDSTSSALHPSPSRLPPSSCHSRSPAGVKLNLLAFDFLSASTCSVPAMGERWGGGGGGAGGDMTQTRLRTTLNQSWWLCF